VVEQLQGVSVEVEGALRTYWDFYQGFGLIITLFLFAQALCLWFLASLARRGEGLALAVTFLVGSLGNAYLSYRFFFALPALFALLIAALIALAVWLGRGAWRPARA
jgi:hypothetical protein